jgi:Domain of unknown function (DUF1707)
MLAADRTAFAWKPSGSRSVLTRGSRGHASMRASDADREVVRAVLAGAYAAGRLVREEYDDRLNTLYGSRTLGEMPAGRGDPDEAREGERVAAWVRHSGWAARSTC